MKKRIIWKMFLLEIVTLGLYRLYWFIKTRKEMMVANPAVKIKSPWLLIMPILIIVLLLFGYIFVMFATGTYDTKSNIKYPERSSYSSDSGRYDINEPICGADLTNTRSEICEDQKDTETNVYTSVLPILIWVGMITVFAIYVIWIWSYAKGVDVITDGKISFALGLVVLILVPDGIDILIIQEYYNKIAEKSDRPPQQQQTVQS